MCLKCNGIPNDKEPTEEIPLPKSCWELLEEKKRREEQNKSARGYQELKRDAKELHDQHDKTKMNGGKI